MTPLNEQAVEAVLRKHMHRRTARNTLKEMLSDYLDACAEQGERMVSAREVFPYLSHRPGCTAIIGQGPDKTDPLIPGSCTCGLRDFAPTEADR
jgi:hypothetical protein